MRSRVPLDTRTLVMLVLRGEIEKFAHLVTGRCQITFMDCVKPGCSMPSRSPRIASGESEHLVDKYGIWELKKRPIGHTDPPRKRHNLHAGSHDCYTYLFIKRVHVRDGRNGKEGRGDKYEDSLSHCTHLHQQLSRIQSPRSSRPAPCNFQPTR
jgi:hypothetical protein